MTIRVQNNEEIFFKVNILKLMKQKTYFITSNVSTVYACWPLRLRINCKAT